MGCDIHIYTESLRRVNNVETWVNVDNWRINPYFGDEEKEYTVCEIYQGRNYELFSFLAGVRNYGGK